MPAFAPIESVYDITYDILLIAWTAILDVFFREVRPRGAHLIPKKGPVIFVAAPHANQFVDPFVIMRQARFEAGRRIAFLTAEKSMKRPFVGLMARLTRSIPVARAQDSAKPGSGTVYQNDSENGLLIIRGKNSNFISECMVGGAIAFPGVGTRLDITEIISDVELRIKKQIKDEAVLEKLLEGTKYKILPYIDQSKLYKHVYDELNRGQCIGVFPEGGSHDRTDLLPLKAGVTIMALGAMANNPKLDVKIVPCGLNYFHPHRFRSRAVIEFGSAISIAPELVEAFKRGGPDKREACQKLLDVIYNALRSVTVNTPDYETLMVIQAGRRLYKPVHGRKLHISQVVELNRRFVAGYMHFKDEPKVKELCARVMAYNQLLRYHALRDHQVEHAKTGGTHALGLFLYRLGLFAILAIGALPGVLLNAPVFIAASVLSHRKAKEALAASSVKIYGRDVLATWKLLVTLGLTPVLYSFYAIAVFIYSIRADFSVRNKILAPLSVFIFMPMISLAALRFGEVGMDIYKSLRPLILSIFASTRYPITNLRLVREQLSQNLIEVINEYGPRLYPDFDANRIVQMARPPLHKRMSNASERSVTSDSSRVQTNPFTNTIDWLDEKVFNWDARTPDGSDIDEVSFYVEGEKVSLGRRSRNPSWASGLNDLSMTSPASLSGPPNSASYRRSRTSSLNEGFPVEALTRLPRSESLTSITHRMNSAREEKEKTGNLKLEKRYSNVVPDTEDEDVGNELVIKTKSFAVKQSGLKSRGGEGEDTHENGYISDVECETKKKV